MTAHTPLPREQFPVTKTYTYLDHAGVAVIPQAAGDAVRGWATQAAEEGGQAGSAWRERVENLRSLGAEICSVPVEDVALVKNTTEGMAFVASGLDWAPGDRVIVPGLEFPSTMYPWLALEDRGVVVERLRPVAPGDRLPLELFEEALRKGPAKVVCTGWVHFGRGWRVDLEGLGRLCREHGALLCVDAIQGLGVVPAAFEEWGVDFAAADGHKWLCGPEGLGVLYVRSSRLDLLRPLEPGWNAVVHRREWDNLELVWDPTARRFEGGSHNVAGTYGLAASLELLLEAGVERIWSHVDALCERAAQALTEAGADVLTDRRDGGGSGIVTFNVPDRDPTEVGEELKRRGFVSAAPRGGGVRISIHGFNTTEEVDALCEVVRELEH